jgi:hypothetical protein
MPVVFSVTRARATFAVGLLRLRRLPAAALSATAALAVAGIQKATSHGAALVATATLAAAVAKRTTHSAPLSATATLAAFVAKATTHSAPLSASAAIAAAGIQKLTTHGAPLSASAAAAARVSLAGRTFRTSGGNRLVFSNGNPIASVTVTT